MINIKRLIIPLTLLFIFIFPTVSVIATAEGSYIRERYEKQYVLDDLMSSDTFNVMYYPPDKKNVPLSEQSPAQVILFTEFCYSADKSNMNDFGLYVYIYNPSCLELDISDAAGNKIQLATKFDEQAEFTPSDYDYFYLEYINKSTGDFLNLYYKFKIKNSESLLNVVNSVKRRYCAGGIYLHYEDTELVQPYEIAKTFEYSGYAKGYGLDTTADSTLKCNISELETITLNVKHTYYRTNYHPSGIDYRYQLNSAYFSVPNDILNKYGTLQKIKAQWYDYRMKPAIVTSNADVYNQINQYIGKTVDLKDFSLNELLNTYGLFYGNLDYYDAPSSVKWSWFYKTPISQNVCDTLYNGFKVDSISYDNQGRPISGDVSVKTVTDWVYDYSQKYPISGYLDIPGRTIASDLFEPRASSDPHVEEFDASIKTFEMKSYKDGNPSWSDNVKNFGFFNTIFGAIPEEDELRQGVEAMSPIIPLLYKNINKESEEVSNDLYVGKSDVNDMKEFVNVAEDNNETAFLFRYALSDYYSVPLYIQKNNPTDLNTISNSAYMAQQTVYLDFQIIHLTFQKEGKYYVIPVVNAPTDAIGGYNPPSYNSDSALAGIFGDFSKFLSSLFLIIGGILLFVILLPVLPWIIKAVIWLIALPFKLIGAIFKGVKKTAKTKSNNKRYAR
jgi:hypothetical protein